MSTTFMKQCEDVAVAYEALQKALAEIRSQVGDLPNGDVLSIARTVAKRGAVRHTPHENPKAIKAAFDGGSEADDAPESKTGRSKDPEVIALLPKSVRKAARIAFRDFKGKTFAMSDIGASLGVDSRTLIPSFRSLERQGLFIKIGRDKRNGQEVNVYTLGKALTTF
jgi:hypothetical protein